MLKTSCFELKGEWRGRGGWVGWSGRWVVCGEGNGGVVAVGEWTSDIDLMCFSERVIRRVKARRV